MSVQREKLHVTVDVGPSTLVVAAEVILILLKILGYITYSWLLVLSPIILIVSAASLILLATFLKLLKDHLF